MQQFYASMLYVRRDINDMPPAGSGVRRLVGPDGAKVANDNLWFFRGGRLFQQFVCTEMSTSCHELSESCTWCKLWYYALFHNWVLEALMSHLCLFGVYSDAVHVLA